MELFIIGIGCGIVVAEVYNAVRGHLAARKLRAYADELERQHQSKHPFGLGRYEDQPY